MKKISVDVPDDIYHRLKEKSTDETKKKKKFVGMNDLILPVLEKEFGNKIFKIPLI